MDVVEIKGAREHNLKNVSLSFPRNKLIVITGLSGSGKSSLAFDTLFAEGQRRYLESLSAYARQFMEQLKKPDVDSIDGLSPAISIEQKNISRNPRSTVGTTTEVYDYLRLLFARLGKVTCFNCGSPISTQSIQQMVHGLFERPEGTKISILAPVVREKKGEYQKELAEYRAQGFVRVRVDGKDYSLSEPISLKKTYKHSISVYVDRLILRRGTESRLAEALQLATDLASGLAEIQFDDEPTAQLLSRKLACAQCGTNYPEIEPRIFSFNNPQGACEKCSGMGSEPFFDENLIIPDPGKSILEGGIAPWAEKKTAWVKQVLEPLAQRYKFSLETPISWLSPEALKVILYGSGEEEFEFDMSTKGRKAVKTAFSGVVGQLDEKWKEADSDLQTWELLPYLGYRPCTACNGSRLKKQALFVKISEKNIAEVSQLNAEQCLEFLSSVRFTDAQKLVAEPILKEIGMRLRFLLDVGLSYLSLDRSAATLSGGESQRIRLATQVGSGLVGVLYVLDEPSIGLHPRDNNKLLDTLQKLRDQGNTVVVVEHDEATMEKSDLIVDLGPGAGVHGGEIVARGTPKEIKKAKNSLTGAYLSHRKTIPIPKDRRILDPGKCIEILGAHRHNLKNIDVRFPLGLLIGVTGVSGSGKSSLIIDTLLPSLQLRLSKRGGAGGFVKSLTGFENIDKVVYVDQSPIGRTPRSNPSTYTGLFTEIRALFANLPEAKARGFTQGRFSFNVPGGRCETCEGDGTLRISMNFLPDVYVQCDSCRGKRYNRETLQIHYRTKTIADVLDLSIEEACSFFERIPSIHTKLATLNSVGLGYIHLGQSAVTLSGGEAQRVKLAKELLRRATGKTFYILDEPTTGLHFEDIRRLMEILQLLVSQGNTVVVIEHNLDVIKQTDYVIDLGPEGGEAGGQIVFAGTPEELSQAPNSHTGKCLRELLGN